LRNVIVLYAIHASQKKLLTNGLKNSTLFLLTTNTILWKMPLKGVPLRNQLPLTGCL
jgi:hypothetical protein